MLKPLVSHQLALMLAPSFLLIFCSSSSSIGEELTTKKPLITQEIFESYADLNEFIEAAPQVTMLQATESIDIMKYGPDVMKTLTGPDCNRDGKMDDLTGCRAEFLRLWLKFKD